MPDSPHVCPSSENRSGSPPDSPPISSLRNAEELHRTAREAFVSGNRGKLTLLEVLRVMEESRAHARLGFPSITAYADACFKYRRSETREHLRVAKALTELPRCREAFATGRLSWSCLKQITRVASNESEGEWIEFVAKQPVRVVFAAVKHAERTGSDRPSEKNYGLPNLEETIVLRLSLADAEKLRQALRRLEPEIAERLGKDHATLEETVLYLAERVLRGEQPAPPKDGPPYALVYQACASCRAAGVHTDEGLVEVDDDTLERVEAEVAPPTPPAMRRKILLREGLRCANPHCTNPADHCHHIRPRSEGGPTEPSNEIAVCATCHALIHAGLLEVNGVPGVDLAFRPKVPAEAPAPVSPSPFARKIPSSGTAGADAAPRGRWRLEDLRVALKRMGFSRREADERLEQALTSLQADTRHVDAETLLRAALRGDDAGP